MKKSKKEEKTLRRATEVGTTKREVRGGSVKSLWSKPCEVTVDESRTAVVKENTESSGDVKAESFQPFTERPNYFQQLPDEMLTKLFSFFKPLELLQVSRVCKHWYKVAAEPSLWQTPRFLKAEAKRRMTSLSAQAILNNGKRDKKIKLILLGQEEARRVVRGWCQSSPSYLLHIEDSLIHELMFLHLNKLKLVIIDAFKMRPVATKSTKKLLKRTHIFLVFAHDAAASFPLLERIRAQISNMNTKIIYLVKLADFELEETIKDQVTDILDFSVRESFESFFTNIIEQIKALIPPHEQVDLEPEKSKCALM